MDIIKCPNCNESCSKNKFIEVPFSYLMKYGIYLRSQTTFNQLRMEKQDICSYVTPILVLEHKEFDQEQKKKEFTQIKIGVNTFKCLVKKK